MSFSYQGLRCSKNEVVFYSSAGSEMLGQNTDRFLYISTCEDPGSGKIQYFKEPNY